MPQEKSNLSVLIVSATEKAVSYIGEILESEQFSPIRSVSTSGEAKRLFVDTPFDIVIINTPLTDDFGIQLAIDIATSTDSAVLVFVKAEMYEQICYKTEDYGIFTLSRPTNRQAVYQGLKMLAASRLRIKKYEEKTQNLESKMKEIRIVNRAKLLLMGNLGMSEADAHRYIEKTAMDNCVKKSTVAENIIKTYE